MLQIIRLLYFAEKEKRSIGIKFNGVAYAL